MMVAYIIFFAKNTYVEWMDFIRYNNINYENTKVEVESYIVGNELGEICEKAPNKINHLRYQPRNGQAGVVEKGTKFYEILGYEENGYIAVCIDEKYILYKASGYEVPAIQRSTYDTGLFVDKGQTRAYNIEKSNR